MHFYRQAIYHEFQLGYLEQLIVIYGYLDGGKSTYILYGHCQRRLYATMACKVLSMVLMVSVLWLLPDLQVIQCGGLAAAQHDGTNADRGRSCCRNLILK